MFKPNNLILINVKYWFPLLLKNVKNESLCQKFSIFLLYGNVFALIQNFVSSRILMIVCGLLL